MTEFQIDTWASAHGFLPGSAGVGKVKAVSQSVFMMEALQITQLFQRQENEMQAALQFIFFFEKGDFLDSFFFFFLILVFLSGSLDVKAPYKYQTKVSECLSRSKLEGVSECTAKWCYRSMLKNS